jgi:hypothetical protein
MKITKRELKNMIRTVIEESKNTGAPEEVKDFADEVQSDENPVKIEQFEDDVWAVTCSSLDLTATFDAEYGMWTVMTGDDVVLEAEEDDAFDEAVNAWYDEA